MWYLLPLLGHPLGAWVLTLLFVPSYLSQCGFFLYILSCRRAVLLVIVLFSERVVSYVVVVLVFSWEEVSSVSSYSAILILPPTKF